MEGSETLPFLSILFINVETNKFMIINGLSWDIMGVNGITNKLFICFCFVLLIFMMMHKPGSVNYYVK